MSDIIVYYKEYCPYCRDAKRLLEANGLDYSKIEVTNDQAAFSEMVARSGRRTVPQIFIDGIHVGGFDDLQRYFGSQRESALYQSAGAAGRY